jgi:hypothetical protein
VLRDWLADRYDVLVFALREWLQAVMWFCSKVKVFERSDGLTSERDFDSLRKFAQNVTTS